MPLPRASLSAIGHAGLPFWSPVDVATLDRLVDGLGLGPGGHIVDLGCGDGAMLAHLVKRYAAKGTGIDRDPDALTLARRHEGPLSWRTDLPPLPAPGWPPDLLVAVGSVSPVALAGLPFRPGALLVGELVALGTPAIPRLPAPGTNGLADAGWQQVDALVLGEESLQAYEARWLENVRAWAHPEVDLTGPIAAHEAIRAAGGLGFELTTWRA